MPRPRAPREREPLSPPRLATPSALGGHLDPALTARLAHPAKRQISGPHLPRQVRRVGNAGRRCASYRTRALPSPHNAARAATRGDTGARA
jgi:hypothetical protein